jgi:hypothetical protein
MLSDLLECCPTSLLWVFDQERIYKFSGILILKEFWEAKVAFFDCSIDSIGISCSILTEWQSKA